MFLIRGYDYVSSIESFKDYFHSVVVDTRTKEKTCYFLSKKEGIEHLKIEKFNSDKLPLLNMYWLESLNIDIQNESYFNNTGYANELREKILKSRKDKSLISLKNFVNLTELWVSGTIDYKDFSYMKKLEFLSIHGHIDQNNIYYLIENILSLRLKNLDLQYFEMTDDVAYFISSIQTLERIEANFEKSETFTEIGLVYMSKLKNLKEFGFNFGYEHIDKFKNLKFVEIIDYSYNKLNNGSNSELNSEPNDGLKGISNLERLTHLDFTGDTDLSEQDLIYIGLNGSIQVIAGLQIECTSLYHFRNLPLKSIVIDIDMNSDLSGDFFANYRKSILFNSIEVIKLKCIHTTNKFIHNVTSLPNLTKLTINTCTVTDEIFNSIAKNCYNLKKLKVKSIEKRGDIINSYCLSGKSLMYLTKFEMPYLEDLILLNFSFMDIDFNYFYYFKMPSLKILKLNGLNNITLTGFTKLANSKIGRQINHLRLGNLNGFEKNIKNEISNLFRKNVVSFASDFWF